jgi:hypothetical protein
MRKPYEGRSHGRETLWEANFGKRAWEVVSPEGVRAPTGSNPSGSRKGYGFRRGRKTVEAPDPGRKGLDGKCRNGEGKRKLFFDRDGGATLREGKPKSVGS